MLHGLAVSRPPRPSPNPDPKPNQAAETTVAEALLVFGEVAAGGVKFHRQGAKFKQRRRQDPSDGLALHAFCRFLRPGSASQVSSE